VLTVSEIIHGIPLAFATGNSFLMKGGTLKNPKILIFFIIFVLGAPAGMAIGMILKFLAEKPIEDHDNHEFHDGENIVHDNLEISNKTGKPISALVIIIL